MRRLTVSQIIFTFFLIFTLISAIAIYLLMPEQWMVSLPALLPWLIAFFKILYDASSKFYLLVNRWLAFLTNRPTRWEFSIQYVMPSDYESALSDACNTILQLFPKGKLWQDIDTQKIVHLPGFTVRLRHLPALPLEENEPSSKTNLFVDLTDLAVPYRSTEKILYKDMLPLFEKLSKNLNAEWIKYTLRIKYDGTNPFFGLYIRKLPPAQVTKFHCEIFEIIGDETDNINIEKEETVIITTSISGFLALSKKYFLYSFASSG